MQQHWPGHRDQWLVYNSSNITVRNLVIHGPNPNGGTADYVYVLAYEAQAGFEFYDTTNSLLENCTISYTYGDLDGYPELVFERHHSWLQSLEERTAGDHRCLREQHRDHANASSRFAAAPSTSNRSPPRGASPTCGSSTTRSSGICLDTIAAKAQGDVSQIVIAYNKLTSEPLSIRNTPDAVVIPPRHDWYVIGNVSDTMFGSPHGVYWITYTRNVTVRDNYQPLQAGRGQIAV